jgi:hypothetical protein
VVKYARQRDLNEKEIVDALVAVGASVTKLNGTGVPDLLVGYQGATFLLEVKRPLGARGGRHHHGHVGDIGDMTGHQVKWWSEWTGARPVIVRTPAEARAAIGAIGGA